MKTDTLIIATLLVLTAACTNSKDKLIDEHNDKINMCINDKMRNEDMSEDKATDYCERNTP